MGVKVGIINTTVACLACAGRTPRKHSPIALDLSVASTMGWPILDPVLHMGSTSEAQNCSVRTK